MVLVRFQAIAFAREKVTRGPRAERLRRGSGERK
jgi:hypothetical protein